jgi:hypothetical protein
MNPTTMHAAVAASLVVALCNIIGMIVVPRPRELLGSRRALAFIMVADVIVWLAAFNFIYANMAPGP